MYDLSLYIAHRVLHDGDGQISNHASGGELGGSPTPFENISDEIKQKDILYKKKTNAWKFALYFIFFFISLSLFCMIFI